MIFILLILIEIIFVKSPKAVDANVLRSDCYASFSNPVIHMKFSHYYPSGPPYLYGAFLYFRYSLPYGKLTEKIIVNYYFKKIDAECESSIILTTLGEDFKKLYIMIHIYLFKGGDVIAYIEYMFRRGFYPGVYGLYDFCENFILYVNVIDEKEKYFGVSENSNEDAKTYLKNIKGKNEYLCVVTENNHAVVLTPNYESDAPDGFITVFQAKIYRNGKYIGLRDYPAFECQKDKSYSDTPVLFVIDGQKFNISFRIIYRKYFEDSKASVVRKFKLSAPKFEYVNNSQNIQQEYNKVFLIKKSFYNIKCPDGSLPLLYESENSIIYSASILKDVKLSSFVEYRKRFNLPLSDLCI